MPKHLFLIAVLVGISASDPTPDPQSQSFLLLSDRAGNGHKMLTLREIVEG